jgi:hypothetical protein
MSTEVKKSPGTELKLLMGAMGFPEQTGNLAGAALDQAIRNDLGIARNFMDAFSGLTTNDLDRALGGGRFSEAGHFPRPKDVFKEIINNNKKNTYYDREKIQVFDLGVGDRAAFMIDGKLVNIGQKMSPAQFETKLRQDDNFRRDIEKQLDARIILGGSRKLDGKITLAKPGLGSSSIFLPQTKALSDLQKKYALLKNPVNRDHRSTSNVRDHRTPSFSAVVRDHRTKSNPNVRDHRSNNGIISNSVGDSLFEQLYKHLTPHEQGHQVPTAPHSGNSMAPPVAPQSGGGSPEGVGSELGAILRDPNLPFEEKLALFLFAFLKKSEDKLAKMMEEMEKTEEAEKSKKGGGGGFNLGGIAQIGGAVAGGLIGGPAGVATGAQIGGVVGNAVDGNKGGGVDGSSNGKDGQQTAMEKLKIAQEQMTTMFSLVDNILKNMNDVVKQGPLAAIRG